ncbi:MAG: hypothetical protein ACTHW3_10775 [Leucobacter sp.]
MGRIPGYYEWDDDDLTPGQKKEGGLHQNLFDDEGKLKGSARFIPSDEDLSDPLIVTGALVSTLGRKKHFELAWFLFRPVSLSAGR